MELLAAKFGQPFNSVQMVVYTPGGVVEQDGVVVGMNFHSDDEQYLSGDCKQYINNIAIASLNLFTDTDEWVFNVCSKGKITIVKL